MYGRRNWLRILLALLACVLWCAVPASAARLSGVWQYREAEQGVPEAQMVREAQMEARDWTPFDFPARPEFAEGTRTLYYTTQVLPGGVSDTLLFFVTGESVHVFLDEQPVYTYDEEAPTPSGSGRSWHLVHLPQLGHPYALTLELASNDPKNLGLLRSFSLGTEQQETEQIFLSDASLILTLPVAVCMFLITVLFCRREHEGRAIYRTLLAFLGDFILWSTAALNTKYFLTDAFVPWWYVLILSAYFLPITAYALVYVVLRGRPRRVVGWFIWAFCLLFLAALFMEIFGLYGLMLFFPLYFGFMALFGPSLFWWTFRGARQGDSYCRALLVPIVMFTVLGVADGFNTYWHFLPGDTYLSPFGIYGIAVFLLAILRRMIRHEEELGAEEEQLRSEIATARDRETHDPLTHCLNRTLFRPLLERYLGLAVRRRQPFSLIMLDIDHFKRINDTYGHEAGDEVLVSLTRTVQEHLVAKYSLVRWGGEEFFVLCPGLSLDEAAALAELLRQAVHVVHVREEQISASFGVATAHGRGDDADALCARADAALYAAKESGRDRVVREAAD